MLKYPSERAETPGFTPLAFRMTFYQGARFTGLETPGNGAESKP